MVACCVWCLGAASRFRIPSAQASCVCGGDPPGLAQRLRKTGLGFASAGFSALEQ